MRCVVLIAGLTMAAAATADGPADNRVDNVRQVPRPGIEVKAADRADLEAGLAELGARIDLLSKGKDRRALALLPDVRIFHKAVHDALTYREFQAEADVAKARELLQEGKDRADLLAKGSAPWAVQTGLVVRGYVSKVDGSVQPYGLVIPEGYRATGVDAVRLDVWFHGRGESLIEVNFLDDRRKKVGEIAPADAIVLHPYGRFCNAFKFAGEVDVLEAIDAVRANYRIDDDRTGVRGFSMGGAACWQLAVHYPDRWYAAAPGAGFSETPRFLDVFQKEALTPAPWEKALWHLYDAADVPENLLHLPTIAYSGELDIQKQAADVMAEAIRPLGVELTHIIGPATKHAYHPAAKAEIERRMTRLAKLGRDPRPTAVDFATYSLRYNRSHWVVVDALQNHWSKATVRARIIGLPGAPMPGMTTGGGGGPDYARYSSIRNRIIVTTANVTALTLDMPPGTAQFDTEGPNSSSGGFNPSKGIVVMIDGQWVGGPLAFSDGSWRCPLVRDEKGWHLAKTPDDSLRKRHGLQGPIDDAFLDSFLFVNPTGSTPRKDVAAWVDRERARAADRWRRQFRGEAPTKDDSAVTDADIASSNLVLWGDPSSNSVLKRVADKLPIRWEADAIRVGDRSFDPAHHALILIAPNPLNPSRYVVLNSGFTYREYDDLNNARQTPKLPDWAVIDLRTPPDSRRPGAIAAADFFGEDWKLKPSDAAK